MSKLDDLLDEMYADEKFMNKRSMQSRTYTDEPIIRRASAMKNYTPPKIAEMRKLAEGQGSWNWSSPKLFVRQGRLMADYEDDFQYSGTFFRYYPTYQLMSDVQLRGYFTWRAKVRRGQIEYIPLSFVFVYIYELLNLIGADSPEEAFEKLVSFREAYAPFDGSVAHYLKDWLVDFAACYGLDPVFLREEESLLPYQQFTVLFSWRTRSKDELFAALSGLSSYNIEKSKFYKAYPEETKEVLCRVFAAFSEHHAARCKNSLCERLFGKVHTLPYTMFSSAVVAVDKDVPDRDYEIYPWFSYSCRNGVWYRTRLDRNPAKNRKLGELVRDVDAILRERFGFDAPLKQTDKTKLFTGMVNDAIDAVLEEKRKKAAAEIRIDVSKLNAIRSDAAETGEKLMTEEERGGSSPPLPVAEKGGLLTGGNKEYRDALQASETTVFPTGQESGEVARCLAPFESGDPVERSLSSVTGESRKAEGRPTDAPDSPLDETETVVLRAILTGGDASAAAKTGGRMISVVIDAINDKLFDRFGDTAIYYEGDTPAVYEDYADELKGMTQA